MLELDIDGFFRLGSLEFIFQMVNVIILIIRLGDDSSLGERVTFFFS